MTEPLWSLVLRCVLNGVMGGALAWTIGSFLYADDDGDDDDDDGGIPTLVPTWSSSSG